MKQRLLHILLCFVGLLSLGACKQQEEVVEETTLSLSVNALELTSEAGDHQVNILSNQPNWSYTLAQAVDWLTIQRSADVLTLSASANTSEEPRRATLLVRADDALQRLVIVQQGVSPEFSLEAGAQIRFSSLAGERTISLAHLGQKAKLDKLDEDASWLSVRQLKNAVYSLRVEAQPNAGSAERKTKVIITIADKMQEVEVVQEAQRYYMLPIMLPRLNVRGMISEEEARGSQLIRVPGGDNLRFYHFAASAHMGNPGFIEYDYAFAEDELYTKASVVYKGTERFLTSEDKVHDEFARFMTEQGFERIDRTEMSEDVSMRIPTDALHYFARSVGDRRFVAYITRINSQKDTRVELRHERIKDETKPIEQGETFPELPLREWTEWVGSQALKIDAKKKKSDADQWEREQGSSYDTEASSQMSGVFYSFYKTKPTATRPEIGRGYTTLIAGPYWIPGVGLNLDAKHKAIDDVEGVLAAYDKISYVYRTDEDGLRVIIPAAKKLFADAGYPWVRRQRDGADLFQNAKTRLAYVVDTYKDNDTGKTMLRVRLTYVGQ